MNKEIASGALNEAPESPQEEDRGETIVRSSATESLSHALSEEEMKDIETKEAIQRDQEISFLLTELQSKGLQTLIDRYGSKEVFEAISASVDQDQGHLLGVIRHLEPDADKRAELFEAIKQELTDHGNVYATQKKEEAIPVHGYFFSAYASGGNYLTDPALNADLLQALDGAFDGNIASGYEHLLGTDIALLAEYPQTKEVFVQLDGDRVSDLIATRDHTTQKAIDDFDGDKEDLEARTESKKEEKILRDLESAYEEIVKALIKDLNAGDREASEKALIKAESDLDALIQKTKRDLEAEHAE